MRRYTITFLTVIFILGVTTYHVGASSLNGPVSNSAPKTACDDCCGQCCDQDCCEIDCDVPPPAICYNTDGRENSICDNATETAALYCNEDGSMTMRGYVTPPQLWPIVFTVSRDMIEQVGSPSVDTLLGQGNGIRLYRLVGGGFQINAPGLHGTEYVWPTPGVEWYGCGGY